MDQKLVLTGDMNFKGVGDPSLVFARIAGFMGGADTLFGNLECCFYEAPTHDRAGREGFYAPLNAAEALSLAGFDAVGTANNVNYGDAAILASLQRLDELGISHTGSGPNREEAQRPAIVRKNGMSFAFVQRTSVYWPTNHEATSNAPGVAVLKGHTAYRPLMDDHAANRPGVAPEIITWADWDYLNRYQKQLSVLSADVDFLVASHHWGDQAEVFAYQTEIAHAAIDSGADLVFGHGPPVLLGIEVYRGKPIFYGTGCFSFGTGHQTERRDWIGSFVTVQFSRGVASEIFLQFVRCTERNETILRMPEDEPASVAQVLARSAALGTDLVIESDRLTVWRCAG